MLMEAPKARLPAHRRHRRLRPRRAGLVFGADSPAAEGRTATVRPRRHRQVQVGADFLQRPEPGPGPDQRPELGRTTSRLDHAGRLPGQDLSYYDAATRHQRPAMIEALVTLARHPSWLQSAVPPQPHRLRSDAAQWSEVIAVIKARRLVRPSSLAWPTRALVPASPKTARVIQFIAAGLDFSGRQFVFQELSLYGERASAA